MKNISIIAGVGKNLELGKNNDLLWHLPNDLKYFKKTTLGKTVVMGKKTYDSLPSKLPNRRNIVIMLKEEGTIEGVSVFNSIQEVLDDILKTNEEVFIIGGGSIYKQFLPYADKLYLTEVDKSDKDATVYFPTFNKDEYNRTVIGDDTYNGIYYQFVLYERKTV